MRLRSLHRLAPVALALAACGAPAPTGPVPAVPRPPPEAVRLAVGARFSCALPADGSVWCWGELPAEVRGLPPAQRLRAPHAIVGLERVHELAADDETLCARTADRRVLCWGEDVRGDAPARGPLELAPLRGATSIAAAGERVCGIVGARLVCVGPNVPTLHDVIGEGSWLAAAGRAICVLDGRGPARCAEPEGHALWPVSGSEGAVSLALAAGVCAVTAEGALRCDEGADAATEASLRPVEGIDDARLVAGTWQRRCVARAERVECAVRDALGRLSELRPVEMPLEPGGPTALALARAPRPSLGASDAEPWHACARSGEVRCWGVSLVGEATGRDDALVERVAERPGARDLVLDRDALVVLDERGRLERVPLRDAASPVAPTRDDDPTTGPLLDLARCWVSGSGPVLCGRQEGDRLLVLAPSTAPRVIEGFAATGRPFAVGRLVCAPARDEGAICTDLAGNLVPVPGLARPVPFEGGLCGLRGGRLACAVPSPSISAVLDEAARGRPLVATPVPGAPRGIARLFGGADQLFAQLEGGASVAMGHNGVGQLGLPPSRPLGVPTPTAAGPFAAMAFARHLSCGWAEQGPLACAGLDASLRPRDVPALATGPVERGDGLWTAIPEAHDVRAVDSDGRITCALGGSGELWCWGGEGGGAGLRERPPVVITLGP